jgi:hypothetical protein
MFARPAAVFWAVGDSDSVATIVGQPGFRVVSGNAAESWTNAGTPPARGMASMNFASYESNGYFDEMIGEDGRPRAVARLLVKDIETLPGGELELRQ